MSKSHRNVWDDIVELGREIIENIDDVLNPNNRRKPAPVPIPVRRNYPPERDTNDRQYQ